MLDVSSDLLLYSAFWASSMALHLGISAYGVSKKSAVAKAVSMVYPFLIGEFMYATPWIMFSASQIDSVFSSSVGISLCYFCAITFWKAGGERQGRKFAIFGRQDRNSA